MQKYADRLPSLYYSVLGFALFLLSPSTTEAHEVYVLEDDVIETAIQSPSFSFLPVIQKDINLFLLWSLITIIILVVIFFASISRPLERMLDPFLAKLPRYAPLIGRLTVGATLFAAAYYGALYGPELPLSETFGALTPAITILLVVGGIMITLGAYARVAALGLLLLFFTEVAQRGWYMLTYAPHAGELLLIYLLGAHHVAVHAHKHDVERRAGWVLRVKEYLAPHAFMILRISFGASLIYSALYAKVIHNNLALAVTEAYPSLVAFFGFTPEFLVLGAAIIEIVVGLLFVLGIEIRFVSLFILFWLSLSIWYFGEVVWPHIILLGVPIMFICYGYDKYSLEGYFFKKDGREPVL